MQRFTRSMNSSGSDELIMKKRTLWPAVLVLHLLAAVLMWLVASVEP